MGEPKVEIFKREDGRWAFRVIAANGEIIATDGGQGYERKADAFATAYKLVTGVYNPGETGFKIEGTDF